MTFQVGEKVVYPNHGVATIENISQRSFGPRFERFYLLRLSCNNMTVMVPFSHVDEVGLRKVTKNTEIARVLCFLATGKCKSNPDWKNRFKDTAGGWAAENGELICKKPGSGDVVYMDEKFENFELSIDWKIAPKGNSGVFIRTSDLKDWINTGMEIQVLDEREEHEANHPSKSHAAGSLYDVVPRPEDMKMKEDDWNHFDIVCNNEKISCKMNGVESFSIDLKDEKWQKPQGKFKKPYATLPRLGYLMLQDHHAVVAFKNIKIKVLPPPPEAK